MPVPVRRGGGLTNGLCREQALSIQSLTRVAEICTESLLTVLASVVYESQPTSVAWQHDAWVWLTIRCIGAHYGEELGPAGSVGTPMRDGSLLRKQLT